MLCVIAVMLVTALVLVAGLCYRDACEQRAMELRRARILAQRPVGTQESSNPLWR